MGPEPPYVAGVNVKWSQSLWKIDGGYSTSQTQSYPVTQEFLSLVCTAKNYKVPVGSYETGMRMSGEA